MGQQLRRQRGGQRDAGAGGRGRGAGKGPAVADKGVGAGGLGREGGSRGLQREEEEVSAGLEAAMEVSGYSVGFSERVGEDEGEGEGKDLDLGMGERRSASGAEGGRGSGSATSPPVPAVGGEVDMSMGGEEAEGGGAEARGFEDEFAEPPHDITDLKRRALKYTGQLVSHAAMREYVAASSAASQAALKRRGERREERVGVVPRVNSYMGEFGEAALPLMEVAGEWG